MENKQLYPKRYYGNHKLKAGHFLIFIGMFSFVIGGLYIHAGQSTNHNQAEHLKLLAETNCPSTDLCHIYLKAYFKTHSIEQIKKRDYSRAVTLLTLKSKYEKHEKEITK